jgi:DAACS family dicarboxylate/amino acid:cation (Na+ or H+) symporter
MVGVPPEGIGIVLGVDRLLDMCRTTLNVAGDLTIAAVVSRGEEETTPAELPQTKPGEPFLEKQV